jgi:putative transposase
MTGVQALERKAPDLPLAPGKVQRREFEYIRHDTQVLIVNPNVVTSQMVSPTCGDTRTEKDFENHIKETIDCDPEATGWHIVMDGLKLHDCVSLHPQAHFMDETG